MEAKAVLNCRGCLSKVDQKDYYSFMWQEIKDLFIECTAIKVYNQIRLNSTTFVVIAVSFIHADTT